MSTASRKIRPVTWQGALSAGMHLLALHKRCAVVHEQKGGSSGKANQGWTSSSAPTHGSCPPASMSAFPNSKIEAYGEHTPDSRTDTRSTR